MADTCSQAIDRLRALAAAADRAAKLRFLADATAELTSSLDYEATLANVAQAAVPVVRRLVLDRPGGSTASLGRWRSRTWIPTRWRSPREFEERYPPDPTADRGSYQVLRSGESQLTPEITDEMLDQLVEDEAQRDVRPGAQPPQRDCRPASSSGTGSSGS